MTSHLPLSFQLLLNPDAPTWGKVLWARALRTSPRVLLDSEVGNEHTIKMVCRRKVVKSLFSPMEVFVFWLSREVGMGICFIFHKLCSEVMGWLRYATFAEGKEMNEVMSHGSF